ncbi:hypothetical protein TrLO_g4557 [Triparma laevis f. longispina]|uniref:Uncharacterized protein n=1 Tax=Triparma laevis f. longispina TaxID=1714387 RepID=A0A9W7DN86_9STRA|nr:hypothetical protein TrLO_g4557 [Triparma laevis f. longispina]
MHLSRSLILLTALLGNLASPLPPFLPLLHSSRPSILSLSASQKSHVVDRLFTLKGGALDSALTDDDESNESSDDGSGDDDEDEVTLGGDDDEEECDESEGSGDDDEEEESEDATDDSSSTEEEEEEEEEQDQEEQEQEVAATAVTPPAPPPPPKDMLKQMLVTFSAMALIKKLDLTSPTVIKNARLAFITYHILIQALVLYIVQKCTAILESNKSSNNKKWNGKMVKIESPWKKMLSAAVSQSSGNDAKNLVSGALGSSSEIPEPEYDINEAKKLRSSQLFPILFMYYLHFKRGSVQPLIYQTIMGVYGLWSNPLVRVYVLGENVNRPFVVQGGNPLMGVGPPQGVGGVGGNEEVISVSEDVKVEKVEEEEESEDDDETEEETEDETEDETEEDNDE